MVQITKTQTKKKKMSCLLILFLCEWLVPSGPDGMMTGWWSHKAPFSVWFGSPLYLLWHCAKVWDQLPDSNAYKQTVNRLIKSISLFTKEVLQSAWMICSYQKVLRRQLASYSLLLQRQGHWVNSNGYDSPCEKSASLKKCKIIVNVIFIGSAAVHQQHI